MSKEIAYYINPFKCEKCGSKPAFVVPKGSYNFLCNKHLTEFIEIYGWR